MNLKLDSLNLDIIEPYVHSNMHISALHGYLSNDIKINGNMRSVMQLSVNGINHIFDFNMIDTLNRTVLSFKDLTVDIKNVQPDKNIVSLNYVSLTDPFILFEMIDSTNNWLALMKSSAGAKPDSLQQPSDTASKPASGSYTFSKLQITGGKIRFSDENSGSFPFEYAIDNLRLESTPVAGSPDKLALSISAALNNTGTLEMKTTLNPASLMIWILP